MRFCHLRLKVPCMLICIFFVTASNAADLYKWTDAAGRTQYSDKKENAGNAPVSVIEIAETPNKASIDQQKEYWKSQNEALRQRQALRVGNNPSLFSGVREPPRSYNARRDNSCDIARAIVNGEVNSVQKSGAFPQKLTQGDIDIAKAEVQNLCNK